MVELGLKAGLCDSKADVFNHHREGKEVFMLLTNRIDFVVPA